MTSAPAASVTTATASYPIYVAPGCLGELGQLLAARASSGRAIVISDEAIAAAHGEAARSALERAGLGIQLLTIPPGEEAKSLQTVAALYDQLVDIAVERSDAIVALGGGVVGDVAGFVAATYLRGLPLVHVPTSLLAMADAAIGGKTGVNHPRGKNLIGAFYQPVLVVEDPRLLTTMSERAYREGFAELIKHGLIADLRLLDYLVEHSVELLARDEGPLTAALAASARVKAAIVSADERESDRRMWLNYGHTVAHAIEAASGYESFLHGEAVSVGMMAVAYLGLSLSMLDAAEVERHGAALERYGLPLAARGLPLQRLRDAMLLDKKRAAGQQRWVLLDGLGNPVVKQDVPDDLVVDALSKVGIV